MQNHTFQMRHFSPGLLFISLCLFFLFNASVIYGQTPDSNDRLENPRPDWYRDEYQNLNGQWDFQFDPDDCGLQNKWYDGTHHFDQKIRVPFCWESKLSGIQNKEYLGTAWYQTEITVPAEWPDDRRLFICFGAVDWKCTLWMNGIKIGDHTGGYSPFEWDITDTIKQKAGNRLTLRVEDRAKASDSSYPALIGKQGYDASCGYSHTGGIWQTVRLEARESTHLLSGKALPDAAKKSLAWNLKIRSEKSQALQAEYSFEPKVYDLQSGKDQSAGAGIHYSTNLSVKAGTDTYSIPAAELENPQLWDLDHPVLYYGTITLRTQSGQQLDQVHTYFGIRKISTGYYGDQKDVQAFCLNGNPVYLSGVLDQGFWPDGIYTAPSEQAIRQDILNIKNDGFHYLR